MPESIIKPTRKAMLRFSLPANSVDWFQPYIVGCHFMLVLASLTVRYTLIGATAFTDMVYSGRTESLFSLFVT